jgi:predicted TIM-barrel fold metal-dependent hydrolase
MHFHVGLRGDKHPTWGRISNRMRGMRPKYDVFLLYAGVKPGMDVDDVFIRRTLEVIDDARRVDRVVCLALDHVYDERGQPRPDLTDFWVANDYVLYLRHQRPDRILFGASVHPYRPDFREQVAKCVADGAVLLKWLPSAQQFTLADSRVRDALTFLATARDGGPLPVLLHVGVEYAVPTTDQRTRPYDYLSWGVWDRFWNVWRRDKWHVPNIGEVRRTIDQAVGAGAIIVLAHCGLPYFIAKADLFEHDDFPIVRDYLERSAAGGLGKGKVYADLSACATPFRKSYYRQIAKLPAEHLLFGTDFPTPVFELHAGLEEAWKDFKAMLAGNLWRIAIPQANLIDANYHELNHFFPGHSMFENFDRFLW